MKLTIEFIQGDLLDQNVEVIINPWNRNLIPWWLLLPHGVSGAIKKRGGIIPFRELRKFGVLPLGGAVITSPGKLPFKAIIHVAGIGHCWTSSEKAVRLSVKSAMAIAKKHEFQSIAFPLIGDGTGGGNPQKVSRIIKEEIELSGYDKRVLIVNYEKTRKT